MALTSVICFRVFH